MVAHKDSVSGIDIEAIQRAEENLAIWFVDALGLGYQDGIKQGCESQAFQLPALHSNGSIRNQPEPSARGAKGQQRLSRIGEKHTRAGEPNAVVLQQSLSQARRKIHLRDQAGEQLLPGSISVAIAVDKSPNVLLLVYGFKVRGKSLPLTSNEPLEASTTVKQGSVEVEDHGLNVR
jgi:hypothetical protein